MTHLLIRMAADASQQTENIVLQLQFLYAYIDYISQYTVQSRHKYVAFESYNKTNHGER